MTRIVSFSYSVELRCEILSFYSHDPRVENGRRRIGPLSPHYWAENVSSYARFLPISFVYLLLRNIELDYLILAGATVKISAGLMDHLARMYCLFWSPVL